MPAEPARTRPMLSSRADAQRFLSEFAVVIADLMGVLTEETEHLAAGRISQGLAQEERKTDLAGRYLQGIECARANAVSLARFAPEDVSSLTRVHAEFRTVVERNQVVIATARAVSEGLIKGVAEDVARKSRPQAYGAAVPTGRSAARPLVFSARL